MVDFEVGQNHFFFYYFEERGNGEGKRVGLEGEKISGARRGGRKNGKGDLIG